MGNELKRKLQGNDKRLAEIIKQVFRSKGGRIGGSGFRGGGSIKYDIDAIKSVMQGIDELLSEYFHQV